LAQARHRRRQHTLRRARRAASARRRSALHGTKALVALVEDGVDRTQENITEDVEVLVAAGLDATVGGTVAKVLEWDVLWVDLEEGAADGNLDYWESGEGSAGREDPTLLLAGLRGAWDGAVGSLAESVVDEAESCAGVSDGGVAGAGDGLAGDRSTGRLELPEALGVVDRGVAWRGTVRGSLVDVAEGVEAVLGGVAEIGGEQF